MSTTEKIRGTILTPTGWIAGAMPFDTRIRSVTGTPNDKPAPPFILPGFVDCHVHGGGGADMMDGEQTYGPSATGR